MYWNQTKDGHYVRWPNGKANRKRFRHSRKYITKKVGKCFFSKEERDSIYKLIRSLNIIQVLIGLHMLKNSKTARHYAESYQKISPLVEARIAFIKKYKRMYSDDDFREYSIHHWDISRWVDHHTNYLSKEVVMPCKIQE